MAQTAHLTLTTASSTIKGESTQESDGRKDTIECFFFEYALTSARDPASGRTTGRRQHSPIKIRKRIDASSPLLAKALTDSELCSAKFAFYRPAHDGSDEVFFSVSLSDAFVSEIKQVLPETMGQPNVQNLEFYEEVTFTFDRICWEHAKAGTIHEDSWSGAKPKLEAPKVPKL